MKCEKIVTVSNNEYNAMYCACQECSKKRLENKLFWQTFDKKYSEFNSKQGSKAE